MIVYLSNKSRFRADILSNRIEEIVHESFVGALGKSVGASELASWKNSLHHMDTVLEDDWIPQEPEHSHSNSSSAFFGALWAFAVKKSFIATRGALLEAAGLANDFPNPAVTA